MPALTGVSAVGSVGIITRSSVYVPTVTTLIGAQAVVTLNALGLLVIEAFANSTAPVGSVILQVPSAGTQVLQGTNVTITLSSGSLSPVTPQTARAAQPPNLPSQILAPSAQLVEKDGTMKANWWRFFLNVSDQAFGTNANEETTITLGVSPFVFVALVAGSVLVNGGIVSLVEYSRNGQTFYPTGAIGGTFQMSPSSSLRITYTHLPTMTFFPK